jgi:putative PEP-CTERM system histidine kinase
MNEIGAIGYALAGTLYLLLAILLITLRRGRMVGVLLTIACVMSVVWAAVLAWDSGVSRLSPALLFVADVARAGAWIIFLARLLHEIGANRATRYLANIVWIGVLVAGVFAWYGGLETEAGAAFGKTMFLGGLAISLSGLVLIEQLYRNSSTEARWSLKLLALGIGGVFAFDLFLYSQSVLFNAIHTDAWAARGVVNVFFVPLIAMAARRNPDWQLRIFVSRQVVFYSTTLIAVGFYLVLMSLGGYLIVRFGGSWGGLAQIVFFVGSIIVLLALLFSSTLRARFKVFLSKHFFQNKYDYREKWIGLIATLSRFTGASSREVVIEAVAEIVDSPGGVLWILDEDDQVYRLAAKFKVEEEVPDIAVSESIVEFMRRSEWIVDLAEYAREPDLYGNLELPSMLDRLGTAWLFVPIFHGDDLAAIVLLNRAPGPPKLNYEDRDLLKTVGRHVAVHLVQEKADRLLAEAKQFEAYNRLTAFLMHDLKNLVAQQSLIVQNAEKHKHNPEFVDDAMRTIAGSVDRMKKVIEQLRRGQADRNRARSPVEAVILAAVDRSSDRSPVPVVRIDTGAKASANVEEFTMILSHLIRNAQEATPSTGSVEIEASEANGKIVIKIIDDGAGMTQEFVRERLFKPFDSTKGAEGMGVGAYQARAFARKSGGDLTVESVPGKGTTVTLAIPGAG